MKRFFSFFLFACICIASFAQQDEFRKAVAKYKNTSSVTASVVKTAHKNALKNDVVTKGNLIMKSPSEVSIVMQGEKDQLLMKGSTFTMVVNGKKHTTSSEKNIQFVTFQAVFESILSGGAKDISSLNDLTMKKQGNSIILTITPQAANKKAAKRIMFSSFVLTIDTKTSELKSLRMNERAGYTEYTFSGYKFK